MVPASLLDVLLRAAEAGLYRPYWSAEILDEVERTLLRLSVPPVRAASRRRAIQREFTDALIAPGRYLNLIPLMANDVKDRHVLAAAVAVGADVIVTFNLRDFPAKALAAHGVEAQSPDTFLFGLLGDQPEEMSRLIAE